MLIMDRHPPTDPRRGSGCVLRLGPMSQAEIGDRWGMSWGEIRRIEADAIEALCASVAGQRVVAQLMRLGLDVRAAAHRFNQGEEGQNEGST